jgi:hypothetical protein
MPFSLRRFLSSYRQVVESEDCEYVELSRGEYGEQTRPLKSEPVLESSLSIFKSLPENESSYVVSGVMESPWIRHGVTQRLQTLEWQTKARSYLSVTSWLASAYLVVLASVATCLVENVTVDVYTQCSVVWTLMATNSYAPLQFVCGQVGPSRRKLLTTRGCYQRAAWKSYYCAVVDLCLSAPYTSISVAGWPRVPKLHGDIPLKRM